MKAIRTSWMINRGVVFIILGFWAACSGSPNSDANTPFANCQFGAPEAIFSKDIPRVKTHQFQLHTQFAEEKIVFEGDILLELIQSGCEKPRQEFQFRLPVNTKPYTDVDWINLSLDMFAFMGNLSPALNPFLVWLGALKEKKERIKLGLPIELEQGFFVKIDKVASENEGILTILLYQE